MTHKRIVCENLRSAYNVWNIIRTADGLGWWVILVWYTAPKDHKKVVKTALGAEESVSLLKFDLLQDFYDWIKDNQIGMISAEKTPTSISLLDVHWPLWSSIFSKDNWIQWYAVVMGNEITGVEQTTLDRSDLVVHIPMVGAKESFNVGQAAAVMMRELGEVIS